MSTREELEAQWEATTDPFVRVGLAHQLADLQEHPSDELAWDERALAAAHELTDERVRAEGVEGGLASLWPSLHLNVADACDRLGLRERALAHVTLARASLEALPVGGYRQMIERALDRISPPPGRAS